MAEVEFERKIRVSREQAGERLIALGKSLIGGARSKLDHDGDSIHFTVADELDWEFELQIDGYEVELEIELKWSNGKPAARTAPAAPTASSKPAAAVKKSATAKPSAARKRAKNSRRGAG
jgi:amphi-Trp domain-containing protein